MGKPSSNGMLIWLGLAFAIVLADQASKWWVISLYQLGEGTRVTSFFNLIRAHNPGAAFSLLADAGGWQRWFFIAFGAAATLFILWMLRSHHTQKLFSFSLACIMGGAIGNVIDRMVHGYVVDMLDFHFRWLAPLFHGGHFPTFNVADMAITMGAFGLILDEILRVRRSR